MKVHDYLATIFKSASNFYAPIIPPCDPRVSEASHTQILSQFVEINNCVLRDMVTVMTAAMTATNGDGRLLNFKIAKAAENEPLSFQIGEEKFECLPNIPGIFLAEFIATSENDMGQRLNTALALIRGALQEEEEKHFDAFIRSKKVVVPMRTLAELAAGLFETYAARPTEPPPD